MCSKFNRKKVMTSFRKKDLVLCLEMIGSVSDSYGLTYSCYHLYREGLLPHLDKLGEIVTEDTSHKVDLLAIAKYMNLRGVDLHRVYRMKKQELFDAITTFVVSNVGTKRFVTFVDKLQSQKIIYNI